MIRRPGRIEKTYIASEQEFGIASEALHPSNKFQNSIEETGIASEQDLRCCGTLAL
jgi:hypothetical protein